MQNLMFHRITLLRPVISTGNAAAEYVGSFDTIATKVPANVQPMASKEKEIYNLRAIETTHTVYTTSTHLDFQRDDQIEFKSRRFKVVGVRDLIELGRVKAVDCEELKGK